MQNQYTPLTLRHLTGPMGFFRPTQELPAKVSRDSPAVMTMTDLRQIAALTVEPNVSIEWALTRMREGGVRLLLVTNHDNKVVGLITATDILGEKPLQILRELNVRHSEIRVRDIMTPREKLDFIAMDDVLKATVGQVFETLQRVGRRHALVYDRDPGTGKHAIRGIFSASNLSRQLGVQFEAVEVATTFAEMEAALHAS